MIHMSQNTDVSDMIRIALHFCIRGSGTLRDIDSAKKKWNYDEGPTSKEQILNDC